MPCLLFFQTFQLAFYLSLDCFLLILFTQLAVKISFLLFNSSGRYQLEFYNFKYNSFIKSAPILSNATSVNV